MPVQLDPFDRRDIRVSAKHIKLGLGLGALVVAGVYLLEPESADLELCKEVAQIAYEECVNNDASQNEYIPSDNAPNACGLKRQQAMLDCYHKHFEDWGVSVETTTSQPQNRPEAEKEATD
jgi:hypothetical protein